MKVESLQITLRHIQAADVVLDIAAETDLILLPLAILTRSPRAVWLGEMAVPNVVTGSEFQRKSMKNAAQQNDIENTRTKPASELLPLLARNKQRASISLLSPAKRTALIQSFDNNGLYKQKGCWQGSSDSKPISGSTVADLRRDGMLTVTTNQQRGLAQLTERGNWFARTLIEAERI